MASKRPLALEYTAEGAAKFLRANESAIDALPYVDHVPPELRPVVDSLIEEEKRKSIKLPSDYLRELPPVRAPHFDEHPVLKTEYERVRSKEAMKPLDTTRYRLDPPPQNRRGDVNAWREALNNAHSQLEHQHLRILNQELLLKHGDKAWRAQVQLNEASVKSLEQQLAAIKKETDQLNRERKLQQHAAGAELSKLERQYLAQVRKNWAIERACMRMEEQVEGAEGELQRRIQAVVAQTMEPAGNGVELAAEGPSYAAVEAATDGPLAAPALMGEAGSGPQKTAEEAAEPGVQAANDAEANGDTDMTPLEVEGSGSGAPGEEAEPPEANGVNGEIAAHAAGGVGEGGEAGGQS
ncbi:hypothetical protein Vafri_15441 [Volvox africanus]|uniref:Pre-mRNA-splicing factor SPF27 n=1 Tax=Volvox africanus TaxID=51714 RepID=A0A8J4BH12_9CHLO|nr:hypothetical protein Vafri_15441 [Volvox africanus]